MRLILIGIFALTISNLASAKEYYNQLGVTLGMHTGPLTSEDTSFTFSVKNYFLNETEDNYAVRNFGVGPMIDAKGKLYLSLSPISLSVNNITVFSPDLNFPINNPKEVKIGFSFGYNF